MFCVNFKGLSFSSCWQKIPLKDNCHRTACQSKLSFKSMSSFFSHFQTLFFLQCLQNPILIKTTWFNQILQLKWRQTNVLHAEEYFMIIELTGTVCSNVFLLLLPLGKTLWQKKSTTNDLNHKVQFYRIDFEFILV